MRFQNKLFIGGEFVDALDGATIDVVNPFDGSVLTKVAEAKAADVDRAVDAAAKAFPAWRATPAMQRGRLLGQAGGRDRSERGRARADRIARHRTSDPRYAWPRRAAYRSDVPLLRWHGRQGPGQRRCRSRRGS
jgi:acyl-CoA reductase-like NAD-dependent aldehyde dehydrogenase